MFHFNELMVMCLARMFSLTVSHVPIADTQSKDGIYAARCVQCGHFFKFRTVPTVKSTVTLTVNGQQYTGKLCNANCKIIFVLGRQVSNSTTLALASF